MDKGTANKEARDVLGTLHNYLHCSVCNSRRTTSNGTCEGEFNQCSKLFTRWRKACRDFHLPSKVDPKVIEMMYKMFPKGHSHGQSADRDARHKQAAVHPNEEDFKAAQDFAKDILIKLS